MFPCAYCKSEIESDAYYCDQCGQEIFLCVTCGKQGQGKFCEEEGEELVAARLITKTKEDVPEQRISEATEQKQFTELKNPVIHRSTLKLINNNLGIVLDIEPDALLGRTTGPYATKLNNFNAISSRHMTFQHDAVKGWTCQDIGSTNGSKYSHNNNAWANTPLLTPNSTTRLEDKAYLLIANIEFSIQITGGPSPDTTVRI